MGWTKTRPTTPGFYWCRSVKEDEPKIVEVRMGTFGIGGPEELMAFTTRSEEFRVNWPPNEYEWSGLLEAPSEYLTVYTRGEKRRVEWKEPE